MNGPAAWWRQWVAASPSLLTVVAGGSWLILACDSPQPQGAVAEVGVFYGGQVQKLSRVEVSRVRPPKLGFRVLLAPTSDPQEPKQIHYQVVRPGPAGRRVTQEGTLTGAGGERQLDHVLAIDADARLGLWNVRIVVDGTLVADRAIYMVRSDN